MQVRCGFRGCGQSPTTLRAKNRTPFDTRHYPLITNDRRQRLPLINGEPTMPRHRAIGVSFMPDDMRDLTII
jgi:hypothetical protein